MGLMLKGDVVLRGWVPGTSPIPRCQGQPWDHAVLARSSGSPGSLGVPGCAQSCRNQGTTIAGFVSSGLMQCLYFTHWLTPH